MLTPNWCTRPRIRTLAGGTLGVLLLAAAIWLVQPADPEVAPRGGVALARHLLRLGLSGAGAGVDPGYGHNAILAQELLPGDVLVARAPGSVYGYWSHATVYLGDGEVLGHDILRGIFPEPLAWFAGYERILVLRPAGDAAQRQRVVAFSRALIGRPFHLAAHPRDPRQWSCAKAALAAWATAGVAVGDGRFWPTPDALAAGPAPVVADLRRVPGGP